MSESLLRPHHRSARELSELCAVFGLERPDDLDAIEVEGVASRAETTRAGDLFIDMPRNDDDRFAEVFGAVERGAVAVLSAEPGKLRALGIDVPVIGVDEPAYALGPLSAWVYRTEANPARLLAVTGASALAAPERRDTQGDTAACLAWLLDAIGEERALVTRGYARIDDDHIEHFDRELHADDLHALLARMRELQVRSAAIEVAPADVLARRADGLEFDVVGYVGGLDPKTPEFAGVVELFSPEFSRRGVVLVGDGSGTRVAEESRVPLATVSVTPDFDADWTAQLDDAGLFTLCGHDDRTVTTRVRGGLTSAAGLALAIVMLEEAGWALEQVQEALDRFDGIELRPDDHANGAYA